MFIKQASVYLIEHGIATIDEAVTWSYRDYYIRYGSGRMLVTLDNWRTNVLAEPYLKRQTAIFGMIHHVCKELQHLILEYVGLDWQCSEETTNQILKEVEDLISQQLQMSDTESDDDVLLPESDDFFDEDN